MLGKLLIYTFTILGIFALLMGMVPGDFITAGQTYEPSYRDAEIEETFDTSSLLIYDYIASDNMTYPYTSLEDAPSAPQWIMGLPENQFLEIGWGIEKVGPWDLKVILARHRQRNWIGPFSWYSTIANCYFYTPDGTSVGVYLFKDTMEDYYSEATNGSAFYAKGGVIQTSIVIRKNDTSQTMGENWDDGHFKYYLSYDVNWTLSGINAWNIVGQLLSFQTPNLGIPGTWGSFMSMLIAIPTWACVAYICYKIVMGIIPFVSGGSGD